MVKQETFRVSENSRQRVTHSESTSYKLYTYTQEKGNRFTNNCKKTCEVECFQNTTRGKLEQFIIDLWGSVREIFAMWITRAAIESITLVIYTLRTTCTYHYADEYVELWEHGPAVDVGQGNHWSYHDGVHQWKGALHHSSQLHDEQSIKTRIYMHGAIIYGQMSELIRVKVR